MLYIVPQVDSNIHGGEGAVLESDPDSPLFFLRGSLYFYRAYRGLTLARSALLDMGGRVSQKVGALSDRLTSAYS